MDEQQLLALKPELDRFLDRFAPPRRFVEGLLHGGEWRNAENIAQAMSGGPVRSLQAFSSSSVWQDRELLGKIRCCTVTVRRSAYC